MVSELLKDYFSLVSRSDTSESHLSFLHETVKDFEVHKIALDCIKSGESPVMNGKCLNILWFCVLYQK